MNIDEYVLNAIRNNLTDNEVHEWVSVGSPSDYFYRIVVNYNGSPMILEESLVHRGWELLCNIYNEE